MKALQRWGATLSLVGSTLIATWFGQNLKVLALPTDQVVQKLRPIPVFTIADEQGQPLVVTVPANNAESEGEAAQEKAQIVSIFISQQDAQQFVERLQSENTELGSQVTVGYMSLGDVYRLAQGEAKEQGIFFEFVPMQEEVTEARTLLSQNGQEYSGGVPLFVARGGEQGYLVAEQNNQQVIPFFFEKEQLQQNIENLKQQQPDLASTVTIEVVTLEGVLSTLQEKDDEFLNKIVLMPSEESIEFRRSQSQPQPEQPN
ncbi:MAG: Tic22 family protein [Cyanophyceae cyanobacterium]